MRQNPEGLGGSEYSMQKIKPTSEIKDNVENHLIELTKSGDTKACTELVKRYSNLIKKYLRLRNIAAIDAEEVTQEIINSVFRNIHNYNKDAKFSSWIFVIIDRECINIYRREFGRRGEKSALNIKNTVKLDENNMLDGMEGGLESPEQVAIQRERLQQLVEIAPRLFTPSELRLVRSIVGSKDGQTNVELAEEFNVSKSRISQIIKSITEKIEKWDKKSSKIR